MCVCVCFFCNDTATTEIYPLSLHDALPISFKYYDKSNDAVIEYMETLTFESNMIVGDGFNTYSLSSIVRPVPEQYSLSDAYPNPFNPSTTISFSIPTILDVKIAAYDILGNKVSTLLNKTVQVGMQSVIWNAQDQPSGVYFIRMQSGDFIETQKVMLLQ